MQGPLHATPVHLPTNLPDVMRSRLFRYLCVAGAVLAVLLAGCATQEKAIQYGINGPADQEWTWPIPPETPRVRYVGQIESQYSIGFKRSFWSNLKNSLLGIEPTDIVSVYRPFDAYVDGAGSIYITDASRPAVMVFDPLSKEAREITPTGQAALAKPMGIAGDERGYIYITDPVQRRVVVLDAEGEFVQAYGGRQVLLNPIDVAVSPETGVVYVVDSYLHQVLVFDRGGSLIRRIGKHAGSLEDKNARRSLKAGLDNAHRDGESSDLVENRSKALGEFHYPAFVDVGPTGTVYVSDGMNFRVQAFDPVGNYLFHFGFHGDTPGAFARPKDLAVDREGHVYVVDAAFNNIQIFSSTGELLLAFGNIGSGPGDLYLPIGLAIDDQDKIYVADRYNNRLQIYQYLPDAPEVPPAQLIPASEQNSNR